MADNGHRAGDDDSTQQAGRSNAYLERQNTALKLESDELKARQAKMNRRADVGRDLLAASVEENTALKLESGELKAQQLILEHRLDLKRALIGASTDGICLVDLEGRTLLANVVFEHLLADAFGVPKGATLQQGGAALARRLTDPMSYLNKLHAIADDPECSTQEIFELADGGRAFEHRTAPACDAAGKLIGRTIVLREITGGHEAEGLGDVGERLGFEIAEEQDTAQLTSPLIPTVSRELRAPLTSLDETLTPTAPPAAGNVVEIAPNRLSGTRVTAVVETVSDGRCALRFEGGAAVPDEALVRWFDGDTAWQALSRFERIDETSVWCHLAPIGDWEPVPVRRSVRAPVDKSPMLVRIVSSSGRVLAKQRRLHVLCLDISDSGCRCSWPTTPPRVGDEVEVAWEFGEWSAGEGAAWIPAQVARLSARPFGGCQVGLKFDIADAAQAAHVRAFHQAWLREHRRGYVPVTQ